MTTVRSQSPRVMSFVPLIQGQLTTCVLDSTSFSSLLLGYVILLITSAFKNECSMSVSVCLVYLSLSLSVCISLSYCVYVCVGVGREGEKGRRADRHTDRQTLGIPI